MGSAEQFEAGAGTASYLVIVFPTFYWKCGIDATLIWPTLLLPNTIKKQKYSSRRPGINPRIVRQVLFEFGA